MPDPTGSPQAADQQNAPPKDDSVSLLHQPEPQGAPAGQPQGEPAVQGAAADGQPKPDGAKAEPAGVPEKYEFKPPEGFDEIDSGLVEAYTPVAKELGLSNDKAQKLIDLYADISKRQAENLRNAQTAQITEWRNQVMSSPTFKEDVEHAQRVVAQYMTPEQKELFAGKNSWLGAHPQVVSFLAKIGRLVGNDKPLIGDASPGSAQQRRPDGPVTPETLAKVLYPGMKS